MLSQEITQALHKALGGTSVPCDKLGATTAGTKDYNCADLNLDPAARKLCETRNTTKAVIDHSRCAKPCVSVYDKATDEQVVTCSVQTAGTCTDTPGCTLLPNGTTCAAKTCRYSAGDGDVQTFVQAVVADISTLDFSGPGGAKWKSGDAITKVSIPCPGSNTRACSKPLTSCTSADADCSCSTTHKSCKKGDACGGGECMNDCEDDDKELVLWQTGDPAPSTINGASIQTMKQMCNAPCTGDSKTADCSKLYSYKACESAGCTFSTGTTSFCNGISMTNDLGSKQNGGSLACQFYCPPGDFCADNGKVACDESAPVGAPNHCATGVKKVQATCCDPSVKTAGTCAGPKSCAGASNPNACAEKGGSCEWKPNLGFCPPNEGFWEGGDANPLSGTTYNIWKDNEDGVLKEMSILPFPLQGGVEEPWCTFQNLYGMGVCACNATIGTEPSGGGHMGAVCPVPEEGLSGFAVGPGSFNLSSANCPDVKCNVAACATHKEGLAADCKQFATEHTCNTAPQVQQYAHKVGGFAQRNAPGMAGRSGGWDVCGGTDWVQAGCAHGLAPDDYSWVYGNDAEDMFKGKPNHKQCQECLEYAYEHGNSNTCPGTGVATTTYLANNCGDPGTWQEGYGIATLEEAQKACAEQKWCYGFHYFDTPKEQASGGSQVRYFMKGIGVDELWTDNGALISTGGWRDGSIYYKSDMCSPCEYKL